MVKAAFLTFGLPISPEDFAPLATALQQNVVLKHICDEVHSSI